MGTVVDMKKSLGKPTLHIILFDNGTRERLLLSKDPENPAAKGVVFELIQ